MGLKNNSVKNLKSRTISLTIVQITLLKNAVTKKNSNSKI